jgi:hypothetical protein
VLLVKSCLYRWAGNCIWGRGTLILVSLQLYLAIYRICNQRKSLPRICSLTNLRHCMSAIRNCTCNWQSSCLYIILVYKYVSFSPYEVHIDLVVNVSSAKLANVFLSSRRGRVDDMRMVLDCCVALAGSWNHLGNRMYRKYELHYFLRVRSPTATHKPIVLSFLASSPRGS